MHEITRHATFSRCARYRYTLVRQWSDAGPRLAFIGLNPSTADGSVDDPTTRRCMSFAAAEGFGSLVLINVFAWRDTDPRAVRLAGPPPSAPAHRARRAALRGSDAVVACWGAVPWALGPTRSTLRSALRIHDQVHVFGLTRDGHPRHPLYLPRTAHLLRWAQPRSVPAPYGRAPRRDTDALRPRLECP